MTIRRKVIAGSFKEMAINLLPAARDVRTASPPPPSRIHRAPSIPRGCGLVHGLDGVGEEFLTRLTGMDVTQRLRRIEGFHIEQTRRAGFSTSKVCRRGCVRRGDGQACLPGIGVVPRSPGSSRRLPVFATPQLIVIFAIAAYSPIPSWDDHVSLPLGIEDPVVAPPFEQVR